MNGVMLGSPIAAGLKILSIPPIVPHLVQFEQEISRRVQPKLTLENFEPGDNFVVRSLGVERFSERISSSHRRWASLVTRENPTATPFSFESLHRGYTAVEVITGVAALGFVGSVFWYNPLLGSCIAGLGGLFLSVSLLLSAKNKLTQQNSKADTGPGEDIHSNATELVNRVETPLRPRGTLVEIEPSQLSPDTPDRSHWELLQSDEVVWPEDTPSPLASFFVADLSQETSFLEYSPFQNFAYALDTLGADRETIEKMFNAIPYYDGRIIGHTPDFRFLVTFPPDRKKEGKNALVRLGIPFKRFSGDPYRFKPVLVDYEGFRQLVLRAQDEGKKEVPFLIIEEDLINGAPIIQVPKGIYQFLAAQLSDVDLEETTSPPDPKFQTSIVGFSAPDFDAILERRLGQSDEIVDHIRQLAGHYGLSGGDQVRTARARVFKATLPMGKTLRRKSRSQLADAVAKENQPGVRLPLALDWDSLEEVTIKRPPDPSLLNWKHNWTTK